jgi:nucleoid DNA-binding protein
MTKTELLVALAQATQTDKKTAGAFLDTLSTLAYKEIKKNGEFVLPGFGKLVKQKRKEDQDSSQDGRQIQSRQGGQGRGSGSEKVARTLTHPQYVSVGISRILLPMFSICKRTVDSGTPVFGACRLRAKLARWRNRVV